MAMIMSPYAMPACVTPRGTSHSPKGSLVLPWMNVFVLHVDIFFSSGRGSFVVLSAPEYAGNPPEHHGANVGPGRGPWHVLWRFKVARTYGEVSGARRAIPARAKPTYRLNKCPTARVIRRILNAVKVVEHYLVM